MVVTTIIERYETDIAKKAKKYLLIYGRRKVGKTFMVKNFLKYDIYVLIKKGGGMYIEGGPVKNLDSYRQFTEFLSAWLSENKIIVIDEFQRLPEEFLEFLQLQYPNGRVILTGSSFHIIKDVISPKSPILGLCSDLRLSLISPLDIFNGLAKTLSKQSAFELSPYFSDPWVIPYLSKNKNNIEDILLLSKSTVNALIGEVFLEEEKKLSQVYEGIIRSLALGRWKLGLMADLLYSRKVLKKPDQHLVKPYLKNMESMDLIKRIPIFNKKEFKYMVKSPIMELSFMLDEKYNFFQQDVSRNTLKKEISNILPKHIERFAGELFAQVYDGTYEYFYSKDFDIDFIIKRRKKVLAVGEVKWTKPKKNDIDDFILRTKHILGDKIFFSRTEVDDKRVVSLSPENILEWIKNK
jgi:AAA+ ATPase superfamily predicted ATPase